MTNRLSLLILSISLSITPLVSLDAPEKLVLTLSGQELLIYNNADSAILNENKLTTDFDLTDENNAENRRSELTPVIVNPFSDFYELSSSELKDLLPYQQTPSNIYQPHSPRQRVSTNAAKPIADWQRAFPAIDPDEASLTTRTTIRVGQTLVVHLPVKARPHREYVWKLNVSYDESTFLLDRDQLEHLGYPASASLQFLLDNSGYVSPKDGEVRAHQQFVFRGMEPGVIKLPFLYNRPWFSDAQPGGAVSYVWARIVPQKSIRSAAGKPVKTERTVHMLKGQQIDIKLGNSPHMPYNLWKLMEIFDANTGHIIPGPNQPALLEFVFRDSGYIPPEQPHLVDSSLESVMNSTVVNAAGYQVFTIFARAAGQQKLRFAFVKPWLPDEQFDRTDTVVDIHIDENIMNHELVSSKSSF